MAKVVIFSVPLYGHLNPTLAVVEELIAHGEKVIYYCTDEFRNAIQSTGATFRRYEPRTREIRQGQPYGFLLHQIDESSWIIPQVLDDVRQEQPDYIIYDPLCLWGRLISQILHVPAITWRAVYAANEHFYVYGSQRFQSQPEAPDALVALHTAMKRLCSSYDVQPIDPFGLLLHTEPLNIVFIPRAFHPAGETFDERFLFVGPSIAPHRGITDFPFERLRAQRVLYISLGTVVNDETDFYKMCFTAFADWDWQVILAVGNRVNQSALGPIPHNFQVFASVPQLAVLQHTDISLTHGGMNSVLESLYYGVPLVVIPQVLEHVTTARRVAELGLGVTIEKSSISVDTLREAVSTVTNKPMFRAQVQSMQKIVREAGGYRAAAAAILRFSRTSEAATC